jgi:hypothetical protein
MGISVTGKAAQCAAWRKIMASHKDTPLTIEQVQIHNQVGKNIGCWK